jgi:hypothetical protein
MKTKNSKKETINAVQLKRELQKKAEQKLMRFSEKEQVEILRKKYEGNVFSRDKKSIVTAEI